MTWSDLTQMLKLKWKRHQPLNVPESDDSYFIGEIHRKF
jgi:hypothetical protein